MSFITRLLGVDKRIDEMFRERGIGDNAINPILTSESFYARENEVHFKGNTDQIIRFYKENRPRTQKQETYLFWREVGTKGRLPVMHFPLAPMITKAKVTLVFNELPKFETGDEKMNATIDQIIKDNGGIELFRRAAEMRSYSGSVVMVPVMDKEFSDSVIIRCYPKECTEVEKRYDRPVSATVFETFKVKKGQLYLATEYGKGYIANALLDKQGNKVPFDRLEETKGLEERTDYATSSRLFVEVPNNLQGQSDYFGIVDDFSAVDEAYSAISDLIRKGHIKTYIPKAMAVTTKDGQAIPGDYTDNVSMIPMANPTNAPYKIERDVVTMGDNLNALRAAFDSAVLHALQTTGLSPATLGYDAGGANSSGEALSIRERQSMRTRAEAIKVWSNALEQMMRIALYMQTGKEYEGQLSVTFTEYESPTFDQKVESLGKALQYQLIDRMTALQQLYPDKEEEELKDMAMLIEGALPESAEDILDEEEKRQDEEEGDTEE